MSQKPFPYEVGLRSKAEKMFAALWSDEQVRTELLPHIPEEKGLQVVALWRQGKYYEE